MMTPFMIDALIGACKRVGAGLDGALFFIDDGKACGLLTPSAQLVAAAALIKWHSADLRLSFDFVVAQVDEDVLTPETLEYLLSAYSEAMDPDHPSTRVR